MFSFSDLRKTFDIPSNSGIFMTEGQGINAGDRLFTAKEKEVATVMFIGSLLDVDPGSISKFLGKKVGDKVRTGEVLAQRGTIPLLRRIVVSPVDGMIEVVDLDVGSVVIRPVAAEQDFFSPLSGIIADITPTAVSIIGEGLSIQGAYGEGPSTWGVFEWIEPYLEDPQKKIDKPTVFGVKQWSEAVEIFLRNSSTTEKSIAVIAAAIPLSWIQRNKEFADETTALNPFVLTDGIGTSFPMSGYVTTILHQCTGKLVSLFPETKVYAGAIRPVIFCSGIPNIARTDIPEIPPSENRPQPVRLLRTPYLGRYGTLENQNGTIATVRCENDEILQAPIQNVELLPRNA